MAATTNRKEKITGGDLSGVDGGTGRTYTLSYDNVDENSIQVIRDRSSLQEGIDFSYSEVGGYLLFTFIGATWDSQYIDFIYETNDQVPYSATIIEQMRFNLIQENNSDVLSDDLCNHYLARALSLQVSTDTEAQILYACYLISGNWQSLGFVQRHDGVTYLKPDPEMFLQQYNDRIKKLSNTTAFTGGMEKDSINKDLVYDETTSTLRARLSNDGY